MKRIIVVLALIFAPLCACQKIIDCNGTSFEVPSRVHQLLQEQCLTYREHIEDAQVRHRPRIINFCRGQSFLNHATLECLVSCLSSHDTIQSIRDPEKLLALISVCEYLQAPKDFVRKVWLQSKGKFNNPNLKPYEREFIALGNQLFSLGEYLGHHYKPKTFTQEYSEQSGSDTLSVHLGRGPFRIQNFNGLSRIFDIIEYSALKQLTLHRGDLRDFNLKELVTSMPQLCHLDLNNNKIRALTRNHLEGMPSNFFLILSGNPIESIEDDCLNHDIIGNASGSTIALHGTRLKSEHLEKLRQRWSSHADDARDAVFFTHLLAASFGIPCIPLIVLFARDMDHIQKCRQFDWIDGSVIISAALLTTFHMIYGFAMIEQCKNSEPPSIVLRTSEGDCRCYDDSFRRLFWELFKYSVHLASQKK